MPTRSTSIPPPKPGQPTAQPGSSPPPAAAAEVRDAVSALVRSLERVIPRNGRSQPPAPFDQAALALQRLTEQRGDVTLQILPDGLSWAGESVYTEPPSAEPGFCARLHKDAVRTLTFRRGLEPDEVAALKRVLLPSPRGREDAVTELWKAGLRRIDFTAWRGYQLTGSFADDDAARMVAAIAARARQKLERHVRAEPESQPQPLWDEAARARRDTPKPGDLERRAALIVLRLVEQDHAAWDLPALQEVVRRLLDELFEWGEVQPLFAVLDGVGRVQGTHASAFRTAVASGLAERSRLLRAIELTPAEPRLLPAFLTLLPRESGPQLMGMLTQTGGVVRAALSESVMRRIESCQRPVEEMLRKGEVPLALALIAALPFAADEPKRAQMAAVALENESVRVKLAAIPALNPAAPDLVALLSPLFASPQRELRLAAASALGGSTAQREQAAALFMGLLAKPSEADDEELEALHRGLGRLGTTAGFNFLSDRLMRAPKGLFKRRKRETLQLIALSGLVEERSSRSLKALLTLLASPEGHGRRLLEASRTAAAQLRHAVRGSGR